MCLVSSFFPYCFQGACRHRCQYLIKVHRKEFCDTGGDPTWLDGISRAPQKFRDLDCINKQLAHRPWELCAASIKVSEEQEDRQISSSVVDRGGGWLNSSHFSFRNSPKPEVTIGLYRNSCMLWCYCARPTPFVSNTYEYPPIIRVYATVNYQLFKLFCRFS